MRLLSVSSVYGRIRGVAAGEGCCIQGDHCSYGVIFVKKYK